MPYRIHIDPTVNCAFIRHFGRFADDDARRSAEELPRVPGYKEGLNLLRDFRDAEFEDDSLVKFSMLFANRPGRERHHQFFDQHGACKFAVINPDEVKNAVARHWIEGLRTVDVRGQIFADPHDAYSWLSLPLDYEPEAAGGRRLDPTR